MSDERERLASLHLDLPNHWWEKAESIRARHVEGDVFELRGVPFCAYGLNYGDLVEAAPESPGFPPTIRTVIRRSGHRTLRLNFTEAIARDQQEAFVDELVALGTTVSRADAWLLALDLAPEIDEASVVACLDMLRAAEILAYETCEPRVPGSFDDAPSEAAD